MANKRIISQEYIFIQDRRCRYINSVLQRYNVKFNVTQKRGITIFINLFVYLLRHFKYSSQSLARPVKLDLQFQRWIKVLLALSRDGVTERYFPQILVTSLVNQ